MDLIVRMFERTLVHSLEVAALTVVLLAALRVFRRTLSPAWQYALWMLLIAKLMLPLLPGDLGSQIRWIPLPDAVEARLPVYAEETSRIEADAGPVAEGNGTGDQAGTVPAFGGTAEEPTSSLGEPADFALRIGAMIWISGIALFGFALSAGYLRMARALRRESDLAVPRELEDLYVRVRTSCGVRPNVRLRVTRLVSAPALFGIRTPAVLIPRELLGHLNGDEWECVIRHELAHFKRRDIPVNLLAYFLASVHWFNPVLWYGLRRMRIDQENACDAMVLNASERKEIYASSLIKLLERGVSQRMTSPGVGFFGNKKQIARRLVMIRDYKPAKKKIAFLGATVFVLAAAIVLPTAFAADKKDKASSEKQPATEAQALPDSAPNIAVDTEFTLILPEEGKISSPFGFRVHPVTGEKTLHDGIDFAGKKGSGAFAAGDGTVVHAGYDGTKGFTVTIEHNEVWSTEYRHLDKLSVKQGDDVKAGEAIGLVGSSGNATGPHLHFSVLKNGEYVNPKPVTTLKTSEK